MNQVILYIATSKDGFIADLSGGVDWLPHPKNEKDLEIVGYKKLIESIDVILMGSSSYKQILSFGEWGWPDKHSYVFSSKPLGLHESYISRVDENPKQFISRLKERKSDKDIWLLGGAQLAQSFAKEDLIDEIILTIVPESLGKGIPLGLNLDHFQFTTQKPLIDGMVQKFYLRINN